MMLVCDQLPLDPSGAPLNEPIVGAAVAQATLLRALLKYGSYDRYLFVDRHGVHPSDPGAYGWLTDDTRRRARVVSVLDLMSEAGDGPVVFMTPGATLHGLYGLQHLMRRPQAPCAGMVHSLHGSFLLPSLLGTMCSRQGCLDVLVCSTEAGRRAVEGHIAHLREAAGLAAHTQPRCRVIPLGVSSEYFDLPDREQARQRWGLRSDDVAIVSVGRLSSRSKGDLRPVLVAATEVAKRSRAAIRLYLAGDDRQEHESASLIRFGQMMGIGPLLSVVPQIAHADKLTLLAAADIFVAPSDHLQETFGISVVEAMAAGLPVVAADWNGFRETVVHGDTGLLVPTLMPLYTSPLSALSAVGGTLADTLTAQTTIIDLAALTGALHHLVDNASFRRTAGAAGRRRARCLYRWAVVVARHEELWAELLADAGTLGHVTPAPPPIYTSPPSRVFGHYPTALLSGDHRVSLTRLGERCLDDVSFEGLAAIAGRERMFRRADLTRILTTVGGSKALTVSSLTRLVQTSNDEVAMYAAVARLLKFGALAVTAGIGPSLPS